MKRLFEREEILNILETQKTKWNDIKGKEQDTFHENFIDNVIWTLNMISEDFKRA